MIAKRMLPAILPAILVALGSLAVPAAGKPAKAPMPIAAALADSARGEENRKLDEGRKPAEVLAFAGFKRGDAVADWGAGSGYYSELIADIVGPQGRVYATETPAFFNKQIWDALTEAHPNILPLVAPAQAQDLAPRSLDAIFAHLTYHDNYFASEKYQRPALDVSAIVRNWFAAVKPGGMVVIIDHVGPSGGPGGRDVREVAGTLHRIDPARVRSDMEQAGFVLESESDLLRRNDDPHDNLVFSPAVRGKTDRFIFKFRRPA
jgi:predicted methyltransferase